MSVVIGKNFLRSSNKEVSNLNNEESEEVKKTIGSLIKHSDEEDKPQIFLLDDGNLELQFPDFDIENEFVEEVLAELNGSPSPHL